MREILISEMDERAGELARAYNVGVETIAFCTAEHMDNPAMIRAKASELSQYRLRSVHGPYYELSPCAIDSMILEVSRKRYHAAFNTAQALSCDRVVLHSGFNPYVYYPEWFVPKSIEFWRTFMAECPPGITLMLENVLDRDPSHLAAICDGVNDPRFRLCLDVGHAQVYSEYSAIEWVNALGDRIGQFHLSNNDGKTDLHAAIDNGVIPIAELFDAIERRAPQASLCVESRDAERWMITLKDLL